MSIISDFTIHSRILLYLYCNLALSASDAYWASVVLVLILLHLFSSTNTSGSHHHWCYPQAYYFFEDRVSFQSLEFILSPSIVFGSLLYTPRPHVYLILSSTLFWFSGSCTDFTRLWGYSFRYFTHLSSAFQYNYMMGLCLVLLLHAFILYSFIFYCSVHYSAFWAMIWLTLQKKQNLATWHIRRYHMKIHC